MEQVWTKPAYRAWLKHLKELSDISYCQFSKRIIQTKYQILGVRTPALNQLVNQIKKTDIASFLKQVGHTYYEEVLIEGMVIASLKDPNEQVTYLQKYILKIDNWALCDMTINRMKLVKKHLPFYLTFIEDCLKEKTEFIKRFGFVLLLNYYMEESYLPLIFNWCDQYQANDYYVEMAIAWLLSYCYLVNKDQTVAYLKDGNLTPSICKKSIQKICESRRVSSAEKQDLKSVFIKKDGEIV